MIVYVNRNSNLNFLLQFSIALNKVLHFYIKLKLKLINI